MNSTKKFTVKWNKEVYTIDVTNLEKALDLKQEIAKSTNVESSEQKLIYKGKILANDSELAHIPDGATISMMGTANIANKMIVDKSVTFLEDLSPEEKVKLLRERGEEVVFGLKNLGNTCYLNSTMQCLGRVEELRTAVKNLISKPGNSTDITLALTKSLGLTYQALDNATDTVIPDRIVAVIRTVNPLFAEAEKGYYKQQDAEECWSLLLNTIKSHLPNPNEDKYSANLIEELFGIELSIQLKNVELETEVKSHKEMVYKLICYIDQQTAELVEGLKNSLKENIDLYSELLAKNSIFEKSQMINRLPPYINIQFMRFFWKQANEATGSKAGKAKILKSVIFSHIIDMYDLCTDETKELLNVGRRTEAKMLKEDKTFRIENVEKASDKEMIPTGRYKLVAVVTHQGRSSESGHYIGWVHKKDDKWLKYDDDVVTMVTTSEILDLKGGGDWHMAYICIYKMLEVPFMDTGDAI